MMKYFATVILLAIAGTVCAQPSPDANPDSSPRATFEWRAMINEMDPSDPFLQQEIEKLEQAGTAEATAMLGYLFLNGKGVAQDLHRVYELAEKAAGEGNGFAHYLMGKLYSNSAFAEPDLERSRHHYELSADKGDPYGLNNLGVIYYEGNGVEVDIYEAIRWFKLAGEQGNPGALYNIGQAYYNGRGVLEVDMNEAAGWYRQAGALGHIGSQVRLGDMYMSGTGVEQERDEAYPLYLAAAEQGDMEAQFKLGEWYYADRENSSYSARQAGEWFAKAGDQGHLEAQYLAGYVFSYYHTFNDKGRETVHYLKSAAENGHAQAQNDLGKLVMQILYWRSEYPENDYSYIGEFLKVSPEDAKSWLQKAIMQENGDAMYHMGRMYDRKYLPLPINSTYEEEIFYWNERACSTGGESEAVLSACNDLKYMKYDRVSAALDDAVRQAGYPGHPGWSLFGTNSSGSFHVNESRVFSPTYIDETFVMLKVELNDIQQLFTSEIYFNTTIEGYLVKCTENMTRKVYNLRYLDDERKTGSNDFTVWGYEDSEYWSVIDPGTYHEYLYREACE